GNNNACSARCTKRAKSVEDILVGTDSKRNSCRTTATKTAHGCLRLLCDSITTNAQTALM
ncbi:unnamed protein product, partial [Amoebophrya sp. A25]